MRKLLLIIVFTASAFAQNLTTVTASNIQKAGAPLSSGTLCFTATDANDTPIGFRIGGGGQEVVAPYCTAIANGAIGAFSVANPANTSPANINYRIEVFDQYSRVLRYPGVQFTGATFNLDNYVPSSNLPLGSSLNVLSVGNLTVTGSCSGCGSGGGGGITSLNGLSGASQTFANDTNVTVTSSGSTHTLGWTGTLAAGRLNSNVVQSVTNDANVTGSIASQGLTLGWTGTLAKSRTLSTTVYTDQANTYTSGQKQTFAANAASAGMNLAGVTADPSSLGGGDVWFRSDANHLKFRDAAGTPATHTLFNSDDTVAGSQVSGNIGGNAANVTGIVATANGGTGQNSTATFPTSGTVQTFTNSGTVQNKTLDNTNLFSGYFDVTEVSAPANPASGNERWYASSSTHQIACLTSSGGNCAPSGGGSGYSTVQNNGTSLTQRSTLNADLGLKAVDNSGSTRTDIRIPSPNEEIYRQEMWFHFAAGSNIGSLFFGDAANYQQDDLNGAGSIYATQASTGNPAIGITSGSTSGNDSMLSTALAFNQHVFPGASATQYNAYFRVKAAAVANDYHGVGFNARGPNSFGNADGIWCDVTDTSSAGNWACHTKSGGSQTNVTLSPSQTADTSFHTVQFQCTSSTCTFFWDGANVGSSSTNIPTGRLDLAVEAKTNAAASASTALNWWVFSQKF